MSVHPIYLIGKVTFDAMTIRIHSNLCIRTPASSDFLSTKGSLTSSCDNRLEVSDQTTNQLQVDMKSTRQQTSHQTHCQ